MAFEIIAGALEEIPLGEGRTFEVGTERIAIFRPRAGGLYAVQAECPHQGGPLADGLVGGDTVICPLHSWKFDLRTGEAILGACGLKTYPARLNESGEIVLSLEESTSR